jgi:non-heme chloroperoxidase
VADHVADVVALLDALGIDAAILVGHSAGSVVAQQVAVDHPGRVLGLALVGAFHAFGRNPGAHELWDAVRDLEDPVDPAFVREFQESCVTGELPAGYLDAIVAESLKVRAFVWRAYLRGLLDAPAPLESGLIRAPVLVLWGELDAYCPRGDQDAIVAGAVAARLVTYPEAGHCPHWEAASEVAAELTAFAAAVARGTAPPVEPVR